ncbi:MAG: hypothetical protein HC781_21185 [Leptolyngbyaceae cyanobacterium CSU_1_4]|nr:hypothetical protein [Leptolyngbyaceae cyanobacterium CSU_1_4]
MTSTFERVNVSAKTTPTAHPLEPLTAEEIQVAVATTRRERSLGNRVRFMSVALKEPPKNCVLAYCSGNSVERQAFIVLLFAWALLGTLPLYQCRRTHSLFDGAAWHFPFSVRTCPWHQSNPLRGSNNFLLNCVFNSDGNDPVWCPTPR